MTITSLHAMLYSLVWCALLFAAAAGYGALLLRFFAVRRPPLSSACVGGLGVLAVTGGLLNLLHWFYPALLTGIVLSGALAAIVLLLPKRPDRPGTSSRSPRHIVTVIVLFCCLFALRYGSTVHRIEYQGLDDYEAYLLFPAKSLQLHYFAPDPFNERRLQSSIGVVYFLQDLILAQLPLESTQMADQGLGLLLLVAACFALRHAWGLSRTSQWSFALLAVAMPQIRFNLTMTTLPVALLLAAAAIASQWETHHRWLRALLLGIAAALVIGCKSTYLPHVFLFCAALYALEIRDRGFRRMLQEFAVVAVTCICVLLPWAIAMRQAAGTYFFPVFGRGFDYTSYYHLPPASLFHTRMARVKVFAFVLPLLPFLALAAACWRKRAAQGTVLLSMVNAAVLGTLATGLATGGDSLRRYNYPCMLPALLLLGAFALRAWEQRLSMRRWLTPAVAALLLFWAAYMLHWENSYREMPRDFAASLRPWHVAPADVALEYAALEAAVPPGGVVLETLGYPFLLDFRQHRFFSADFPGAASPPPGWPIYGNGDALARYLSAQGIRYIAYAYRDQAFMSDEECAAAQTNPAVTQAWRNILFLMLHAHQQYGQLAATRRHIFDDGRVYVLDLQQRQ